jgi:hypothetical protein
VDGSLMNKVSHVSLSRMWRVCLLHVSCVDCIFFFVLDCIAGPECACRVSVECACSVSVAQHVQGVKEADD